MIRSIMAIVLLVVSAHLFGQSAIPIAQGTSALSTVPQVLMPQLDNKALYAEEMSLREPMRAIQFAHPMEVDIDPDSHGRWETADNGNLVWRLRIRSATALSLNLGFDRYYDVLAAQEYGSNYEALTKAQQKAIRKKCPRSISLTELSE